MKVLKNNYEPYNEAEVKSEAKKVKPYPRKHICESCSSELEYDKEDLRVGALGAIYIDCPLCNKSNMIDDHEDAITLTRDNIEFPIHFWHTSEANGVVNLCTNEEIKKRINIAIDYLRKHEDEDNWYGECGNLHISVYRYDGDEDYYVVVTNDYYSTYIPFEEKDYKVVN